MPDAPPAPVSQPDKTSGTNGANGNSPEDEQIPFDARESSKTTEKPVDQTVDRVTTAEVPDPDLETSSAIRDDNHNVPNTPRISLEHDMERSSSRQPDLEGKAKESEAKDTDPTSCPSEPEDVIETISNLPTCRDSTSIIETKHKSSPLGTQVMHATADTETSPLPIKQEIKVLPKAEFWERSRSDNTYYLAEVLTLLPNDEDITRPLSRLMMVQAERDLVSEAKPSRVRLRSARLTELLSLIAEKECGQNRTWDPKKTEDINDAMKTATFSVVYLYPFKLFVSFEKVIRSFAKWLHAKKPESQKHPEFQNFPEIFLTSDALEELDVLITLFDRDLKNVFQLRRNLLAGQDPKGNTITMIEFKDLWLLYEPGQLVYEREGQESSMPFTPPRLWRVLQYSGARAILNNDVNKNLDPGYADTAGSDRKGYENRFVLKGFSHDIDERSGTCLTVQEQWTFPAWDGPRDIHQLKAFPTIYCRPKLEFADEDLPAYLSRIRQEGEKFCQLKQGMILTYRGPGIDEAKVPWQYDSEIVIDFERARQEAPSLLGKNGSRVTMNLGPFSFALSAPPNATPNIMLRRGDIREVIEKPPRQSTPDPNSMDLIHDDITMEWSYFKHAREEKRLALWPVKLTDLIHEGNGDSLVIFPRLVSGFVLSARVWANLDMQHLHEHNFDIGLWDEVMLPVGHKDKLMAVANNSNRIDTDKRLPIHGKGLGTIILLQGHPGTGKTFTAQALAAKTERPLYPITAGELGDNASQVEQRLDVIMQRGRRWDCVLLLDEGDVYLNKRRTDIGSNQNSIISVFLRLLETYPGLIIITTNWATQLDVAVLDRITLPLIYPPLNRRAVGELWGRYCRDTSRFVCDRGGGRPRIKINRAETKKWAMEQYDTEKKKLLEEQKSECEDDGTNNTKNEHLDSDTPGINFEESPWASGRRLRMAFRLAISIAMEEKIESKREKAFRLTIFSAMREKMKHKQEKLWEEEANKLKRTCVESPHLTEKDTVVVSTKHFENALKVNYEFSRGVENLPDAGKDYRAANAEELEYDHDPAEDDDSDQF